MSKHLDKAKGALQHASELAAEHALDHGASAIHKRDYHRLLDIATIQAQVAQADALERIAVALEKPDD